MNTGETTIKMLIDVLSKLPGEATVKLKGPYSTPCPIIELDMHLNASTGEASLVLSGGFPTVNYAEEGY